MSSCPLHTYSAAQGLKHEILEQTLSILMKTHMWGVYVRVANTRTCHSRKYAFQNKLSKNINFFVLLGCIQHYCVFRLPC